MATDPCPHCGQIHPENAKFCPVTEVAIPTKLYCPNCKREVAQYWVICAYCGVSLIGGQVPTKRLPGRIWLCVSGGIAICAILIILFFARNLMVKEPTVNETSSVEAATAQVNTFPLAHQPTTVALMPIPSTAPKDTTLADADRVEVLWDNTHGDTYVPGSLTGKKLFPKTIFSITSITISVRA